MKITGTAITSDIEGNHRRDAEFEFDLPLRDLFAAFALAGLIARGPEVRSLEDASIETLATTFAEASYKFADAALVQREEVK